jgi:hypothetical protein
MMPPHFAGGIISEAAIKISLPLAAEIILEKMGVGLAPRLNTIYFWFTVYFGSAAVSFRIATKSATDTNYA